MASSIDATKPADGVPAVKADLRSNLAAAKSEIEELQLNSLTSVAEYGAVGDGVTNDSAAIQAAFDAEQRVIFLPGKNYLCEGIILTGTDKVIDARGATITNAGNGNHLFRIGVGAVSLDRATLLLGNVDGTDNGGHILSLEGPLLHSLIDMQHVLQRDSDFSILSNRNFDGTLFFNTFQGKRWRANTAHNVSAVDIIDDSNGCSANIFQGFRVDRGGVPFFAFECTSSSVSFYSNKIRDVDFEVVDAGAIRLRGCARTTISGCSAFDMGTITNHIIEIGAATGGKFSEGTLIEAYQRNGGTLNSGIYDIAVTGNSRDTTLINCSGVAAATGVTADMGSREGTVISKRFLTLLNSHRCVVTESGRIELGRFTSGARPDATAVEPGSIIYDSTIDRVMYSNGTTWSTM